MENGEENNKQILSNALKELRKCTEVSELSGEHINALNNAKADELYKAYLDIDTYFDKDKCFSIENPCCAYGLCCTGILTTAALCGTVLPCIYNSIPTTPPGIHLGTAYYRGRGIGAVLTMASIPMAAPAVGGVYALGAYHDLEEQKYSLANDNHLILSSDDFLPTLKRIISFHSYSTTNRNNIKQTITHLCQQRSNLLRYDALTKCSSNYSSEYSINSENNTRELIID